MYNLTNTIKDRNKAIINDMIMIVFGLVIAWFTFKDFILMIWNILTGQGSFIYFIN